MEVIFWTPRSWQRAIAARQIEANITRLARNVCGIAPDPKVDGKPVDFTVSRLNTKVWLCHIFAVLRLIPSLTGRFYPC